MNILLFLIAVVCFLGVVVGVKNVYRNYSIRGIFVIVIWAALLILAVFPSVAKSLTKYFGIGENLNTLIFIGFVFLFYMSVRLFGMVDRLQRNITALTREDALQRFKESLHKENKHKV